ncbi:MAG: DUF309 domain-containing protein [Actinomycetes bacterium]
MPDRDRDRDATGRPSTPPDRDRDATGRPSNARARDALGRPLPRGAEGVSPHIDSDLTLDEALTVAQHLLDDGLPFHAHEVLEQCWKAAPDNDRTLWQGLAQLAVGLTHALRGNRAGAVTVLQRGRDNIASHHGDPPRGIDVPGLVGWADALIDQLLTESPGDAVPAARTVPRLRR